ncbi:MAG: glycosyltransferase [Planctomycetota bacterium]|jgi:colanic acid/amylovoran biosynthesis glycosyltransferase
MKIAFIVPLFPTLSETFILNQITGLLDMGHDVKIFAKNNPKEGKTHDAIKKYNLMTRAYFFKIPQNKVMRFMKGLYLLFFNFYKDPIKIFSSLNIFRYGKFALSLKALYYLIPFLWANFDIIHCHYGTTGIMGVVLKEIGLKAKIITTFHGFDISSIILDQGQGIYKDLFSKGDLFLSICNYSTNKLIKLGCDERKISPHHIGIDLQKFEYQYRSIHNNECLRILTIGRLTEKKGHEYSIRALAEVAKKHRNIQYLIAGQGPLRSELESLVEKLGIQDKVEFLGALEQEEAVVFYRKAHIFILPSISAKDGDKEGTPTVLIEAQAMGLPVISTNHSGIPEIIIDGKSGFLVPEKDVDGLTDKIEYLIEHPEIWPEMGRCGRKFVEDHYNIKELTQQLVKIYESVLNED